MSASKAGVDRLGERLRGGILADDDLRELDVYRRSFAEPYAAVVLVLRDELKLAPTGRPAKSTKSIVDKLSRETVRLSQIQDIAGCRVVVADTAAQDDMVRRIGDRFGNVTVIDRRARPSHGYRAVHVLVEVGGRRVEVQIRTALQHLWAELSERLSDTFGLSVKYGGGSPEVRSVLDHASLAIVHMERSELALSESLRVRRMIPPQPPDTAAELAELDALRVTAERITNEARSLLEQTLALLPRRL